MAADYAEQIVALQARGPYHLLGWSLGGTVAHAVAVRLQELGHEVGLLALLDSGPGGHGGDEPLPPEDLRKLVFEGADRERDLDEQTLAAMMRVAQNNVRLLRGNKPGFFRGDVVHFTAARNRLARHGDARSRWQPFVHGRIEDVLLDCEHHQMTQAAAMTRIAGTLVKLNPQDRAGEPA
jgi:thioesterase domain-containing protein